MAELVDKRFKALVASIPQFKDIPIETLLKSQGDPEVKKDKGRGRAKVEEADEDEEVVVTESMLRPPEEESPAEMAAKGKMLGQMREIFGDGEGTTKKYYNFIKKHHKKGLERMVQMWIAEAQQQGK